MQEETDVPAQRRSGIKKEGFHTQPFLLFRSSTNRVRPNHIRESDLLTQPIHSNVTLTQKHPHRHAQNHVSPNTCIWHSHDPGKLSHKVNHDKFFLIHFIILIDILLINLECRMHWGQQWGRRLGSYSRPDIILGGRWYNLLFLIISNWQKSFKNGAKNSHLTIIQIHPD